MGCELQIDGIEAKEYLAALDRLTGIHVPLQNLTGHPKAQVALDASRDYAGEGTRRRGCPLDGGNPHQRCVSTWIGGRLFAAGDQRKRHHADESGQKEAAPTHEEPIAK